jgi:hypothetical protein
MVMRPAAVLLALALIAPSASGALCALLCVDAMHHDTSASSAECQEHQENPAPQVRSDASGMCHQHTTVIAARLDERQASPMLSGARIELASRRSHSVTRTIRLSTFGPPHTIPPSAPLRI